MKAEYILGMWGLAEEGFEHDTSKLKQSSVLLQGWVRVLWPVEGVDRIEMDPI